MKHEAEGLELLTVKLEDAARAIKDKKGKEAMKLQAEAAKVQLEEWCDFC